MKSEEYAKTKLFMENAPKLLSFGIIIGFFAWLFASWMTAAVSVFFLLMGVLMYWMALTGKGINK